MKRLLAEWGVSLLLLSFVFYTVLVAILIQIVDSFYTSRSDLNSSKYYLQETTAINIFCDPCDNEIFSPFYIRNGAGDLFWGDTLDGEKNRPAQSAKFTLSNFWVPSPPISD